MARETLTFFAFTAAAAVFLVAATEPVGARFSGEDSTSIAEPFWGGAALRLARLFNLSEGEATLVGRVTPLRAFGGSRCLDFHHWTHRSLLRLSARYCLNIRKKIQWINESIGNIMPNSFNQSTNQSTPGRCLSINQSIDRTFNNMMMKSFNQSIDRSAWWWLEMECMHWID